MKTLLFTIVLSSFWTLPIFSQDGTLDLTFNSTGSVVTEITDNYAVASSVVIQSDGKILTGGSRWLDVGGGNLEEDQVLIRYNSDGSLDESFGENGIVLISVPNFPEYIFNIALLPDGKIITIGYTGDATFDLLMIRHNSDGSIDTSFGDQGYAETPQNLSIIPFDLEVMPDGSIYVGCSVFTEVNIFLDEDFAICKYLENGTLDMSFGTEGYQTTNLGSTFDSPHDMTIQEDGKILLTGMTYNSNAETPHYVMATVRYNPDGNLDNNFGEDGITITDPNDIYTIAIAIAIQDDGKIILCGDIVNDDGTDINSAIVRLNTDGSVDNSYGENGITIINYNGYDYVSAAEVDSFGRLITVGESYLETTSLGFICRINEDGQPDFSFSDDGIMTTAVTPDFTSFKALALQPDGKIVVAGSASYGSNHNFMVARYNAGTVGISEVQDFEISLPYPNPCRNKLYVPQAPIHLPELVLTNQLGQQFSLLMNNGTVDVSHLPCGIYEARIPNSSTEVFKILIQ
jgi:uncharacterized delta-60 repeat protein